MLEALPRHTALKLGSIARQGDNCEDVGKVGSRQSRRVVEQHAHRDPAPGLTAGHAEVREITCHRIIEDHEPAIHQHHRPDGRHDLTKRSDAKQRLRVGPRAPGLVDEPERLLP